MGHFVVKVVIASGTGIVRKNRCIHWREKERENLGAPQDHTFTLAIIPKREVTPLQVSQ